MRKEHDERLHVDYFCGWWGKLFYYSVRPQYWFYEYDYEKPKEKSLESNVKAERWKSLKSGFVVAVVLILIVGFIFLMLRNAWARSYDPLPTLAEFPTQPLQAVVPTKETPTPIPTATATVVASEGSETPVSTPKRKLPAIQQHLAETATARASS